MNNQFINGLLIDRAVISIKEILFQCYQNNPESVDIITADVNSFVEQLKSQHNG